MVIKLVLTASDYLTYQLYTASKSERIKRNRYRSWLILSGCFLILGLMFYNSIKFYSFYFLGAGVISLMFYPFYQRYHYKKHYNKFILDSYKNKIGKEAMIDFQPDYIFSNDTTGEGKIYTSEVCEINEIGTHYFIKAKTGESLILPKSTINDDHFVQKLELIFNNPSIIINREPDWKWK
ncbi:hypothetical protein AAFN85_10580 [Mucilaginibacter sp. CAU 1740]|uniref:hypothetical protein n=1 Tax=Mucilaginibacter sp. CAU 1740 TaxID=3140365 RepID=UPI00325BC09E